MNTYRISREGDTLRVAFGDSASNDQIVKDAQARLDEMTAAGELAGGGIIKLNGPASLPVAVMLAHKLAHLFSGVACFDPKPSKYVVSITHDPRWAVGDLVD